MEKILNLTDVSDEAFTAAAETIQKWKNDGAPVTMTYQTVEEGQQLVKRVTQSCDNSFNKGYLFAGLAVMTGAGIMYLMDYFKYKPKK
jgi:hypothetical protein